MVTATVPDIVAPATADEAAEVLRAAADSGRTVMAQGSGSKSDWGGRPSSVDLVIDTRRLTGVTAHEPGDLVVTVGAGTQLRDLQATLGLAGQRLALEGGFDEGTVGGVLATGEAGPLRLRYGSGRDLLIGVEFVRADGEVVHSGGRVVKNVAGYDLGRLLCGSYGTLGVITSATFRLHPLPAARAWINRPIGLGSELSEVVRDVLQSSLSPAALEVNLPGPAGTLAVLLEGSPAGVDARTTRAIRLLGANAVVGDRPPWWGRYPFHRDGIALKLALPVATQHTALDVLRHATGGGLTIRGSAGAGVLHAAVPAGTTAGELAGVLRSVRELLDGESGGGSCVMLQAPPDIRAAVDVWGPVPGLALMRRVKDQFDPQHRLAPGRFVGGI
jgi:glycolate oxidase FAD binding subunit